MRLHHLLTFCAAFCATAAANAADTAPGAKRAIETGPALGWVYPVFTDKEGFHLYTLRGAAARIDGVDKVHVTDFSAVIFSGDARERVDTVLLSPQATFFPKLNRASGSSTIRVIHDDTEVVGRGWTYDRKAQRVTLAHDVRVTFQAQMKDILK